MSHRVTLAQFRIMTAIQAALFLMALIIVALEPYAERAYYDGGRNYQGNDVSAVVSAQELFLISSNGGYQLISDLPLCAEISADPPHTFISRDVAEVTLREQFSSCLVATIWCSSEL